MYSHSGEYTRRGQSPRLVLLTSIEITFHQNVENCVYFSNHYVRFETTTTKTSVTKPPLTVLIPANLTSKCIGTLFVLKMANQQNGERNGVMKNERREPNKSQQVKRGILMLAMFFASLCLNSTAFAEPVDINFNGLTRTMDCNPITFSAEERIEQLEARLKKLECIIASLTKPERSDSENYFGEAVDVVSQRALSRHLKHALVYIPPTVSKAELKALRLAVQRCRRGDVEKTVRGVFQGRIAFEGAGFGPNHIVWRKDRVKTLKD